MSNYTNTGLVAYARSLLKIKTKYMWGGLCRSITQSYINLLKQMYPSQYPEARITKLKALIGEGYYGIDCVGVAKTYIMGGVSAPQYEGSKDLNAGALYQKATEKGAIGTMPERPGVIVYCKTHPHVGVYIGNGYVIESTLSARGDGVVKTKLSDFGWEYWFQNPFITADNAVQTKTVKLKYTAVVRALPNSKSTSLSKLAPGTSVTYVVGSDTKDTKTGYVYVKIKRGAGDGWIVKTAL